MTVTAIEAAPRRPAPLPQPTAAEVLALQAVHDYPAISLLCSTDAAPTMSTVTLAHLEQLVDDATRRLRSELGAHVAASLRDDLMNLVDDAKERPTRAAVALYVSSHHASAWSLPEPVVDRAVVDPTFATRDLVRSLHRTPRHVVLVLTERDTRLFDGAGDTRRAALRQPLPPDGPHPPPAHPHRRRARQGRRPGPASRRLPAHRRQGPGHLPQPPPRPPDPGRRGPDPGPLHRDLEQPRAPGRRGAGQPRPHPTADPGPAHPPRPAELLALPRGRGPDPAGPAQHAGTIATGMPAVWLAARAERPEMLAVEEGLFYPARVSRDGDLITPADDLEHPDVIDDAVDEVIETVLRRGGWVALVQDGALTAADRIALTPAPTLSHQAHPFSRGLRGVFDVSGRCALGPLQAVTVEPLRVDIVTLSTIRTLGSRSTHSPQRRLIVEPVAWSTRPARCRRDGIRPA